MAGQRADVLVVSLAVLKEYNLAAGSVASKAAK
jgi:hypothetical protein